MGSFRLYRVERNGWCEHPKTRKMEPSKEIIGSFKCSLQQDPRHLTNVIVMATNPLSTNCQILVDLIEVSIETGNDLQTLEMMVDLPKSD